MYEVTVFYAIMYLNNERGNNYYQFDWKITLIKASLTII